MPEPAAPAPTRSNPARRYREVFAVPGAARFYLAGWFGRLPRSTLSIGAVLLIAGQSGQYSLAAAVAAAMIVGTAVVGPIWSRAMDRLGQGRVLSTGLICQGVAALALLGAVLGSLPVWTWFVAGFVLGASAVDVGSATRARWSTLLPDGRQRHTAFSLESVADESVFVIGPPLVTVLAAAVSPALGFLTGLALGLAGTLALVLERSTIPPVLPRESAAEATSASGAAGVAARRRRRLRLPRLPRGVAGVLPVFIGIGTVFGSIDITAVGYAEAEGAPAAAGLLLAAFAGGAVVAALIFGLLHLGAAPELRFGAIAVLYGLVVPVVAVAPGIAAVTVAMFAGGLCTSPLIISGMGLVESRVQRERLTEALAWPSTALSVGVTAGVSIAGVVIDGSGAANGFLVTAAGAVVAGVSGVVLLVAHRLRSQRVVSFVQGD